MQSASILRRCSLSVLLPLVLLLAGTGLASAQTVINSLPYTITTAGEYVLGSNLSSSQTSGNLITVAAGNVTLDLQGHYLSGPTNYGGSTTTTGIYASERANVTVRNGTISHCYIGVDLDGQGNAFTATNNLNQTIDSLRVTHCSFVGIYLNYAPGSTVTNCKVTQMDEYGIYINGIGVTVQGCVLCQVGDTGIDSDAGSFARQNTISKAGTGIAFGLYQDNLVSGCTTPFTNGTDGGGNASN